MMLDSPLGKILKSKPVEPSITTDNRLTPTKDDHVAPSTKSEAEVRLVVRFFVEEHIVFNGKIEKINQLESEELSRIVSRIEWDGAKSQYGSNFEAVHVPKESVVSQMSDSRDKPRISEKCKPSVTSKTMIEQKMSDVIEEKDNVIFKSVDKLRDADSSPSYDVPMHSSETTIAQDGVGREEPKPFGPKIDQSCDTGLAMQINLDQQSNDDDITIKKEYAPSDILSSERESYQESPIRGAQSLITETDDGGLDVIETDVEAQLASDRQTIVDTIVDCVKSIELELDVMEKSVAVDNFSKGVESAPKIDPIRRSRVHDIDLEPLVEMHNIDIQRNHNKCGNHRNPEAENDPLKTETNPVSDTDIQRFTEARVRSDPLTCKEDISIKTIVAKKNQNLSSNRRRKTSDSGTANKRIRRSSTKDGRKSGIEDGHGNGQQSGRREDIQNGHDTANAIEQRAGGVNNYMPQQSSFSRNSKIFAKWTDNHFYPGTILRPCKDRKFTIGYFDGAQRNVAEIDLIPLCNILGKQVRVSLAGDYCVNAIVHDKKCLSSDSAPFFDVEYHQGGLIRKCVPMKDLFLTAEQGATLINQPVKPDKNPDESMFAGLDLDNIVHVKRSRRLQELEDSDISSELQGGQLTHTGGRKRNQYNTRHTTNRSKVSPIGPYDGKTNRKSFNDENPDTPASSCSPDSNTKASLNCLNPNPPSESNSSTSIGSSNATSVIEMGQKFYFDSSSPHRTKTSLLL